SGLQNVSVLKTGQACPVGYSIIKKRGYHRAGPFCLHVTARVKESCIPWRTANSIGLSRREAYPQIDLFYVGVTEGLGGYYPAGSSPRSAASMREAEHTFSSARDSASTGAASSRSNSSTPR